MKKILVILALNISGNLFCLMLYNALQSFDLGYFPIIFILLVVPAAYVYAGYKFVDKEDSKILKLMTISIISIVGLLFWIICFINYISDDFNARRGVSPVVMPSEIIWILYGIYNLLAYPVFYIHVLFDDREHLAYKYIVSMVFLVANFLPMMFIYMGSKLKKD